MCRMTFSQFNKYKNKKKKLSSKKEPVQIKQLESARVEFKHKKFDLELVLIYMLLRYLFTAKSITKNMLFSTTMR